MEFFIKKNSTIPVIRIKVSTLYDTSYGNNNFDESYVKFTMVDKKTGRYIILNDDGYYDGECFCYKLNPKHTSSIGEFGGFFTIMLSGQNITVPSKENLSINILDSFTNNNLCPNC